MCILCGERVLDLGLGPPQVQSTLLGVTGILTFVTKTTITLYANYTSVKKKERERENIKQCACLSCCGLSSELSVSHTLFRSTVLLPLVGRDGVISSKKEQTQGCGS